MSLRVTHRNPTGHLVEIPADVLDLDRRIKEGDPTADWGGDPRMYLVFNGISEKYQVWRRCEDGKDRQICNVEHRDSRLLRHLGEIDSWRRGADILGDLDRYNEKLERLHKEQQAELIKEIQAVYQFAMPRSHLPGYFDIKGKYVLSPDSHTAANPQPYKTKGV